MSTRLGRCPLKGDLMNLSEKREQIVKSSVVAGVVFIIVCLAALGVWGIDSDGDSVPDSSIQSETVGSVGVHVSVTETEDEVAAYGLYVDGVFVAACPTDEEVDLALESALNDRATLLGAGNSAAFANDIECVAGVYDTEYVVDGEKLSGTLSVVSGDVTEPILTENGEEIVFEVEYTATVADDVVVEYPTIYCDNDARSASYTKTLQNGVDGLSTEYYTVSYINGNEVARVLSDTVVITEPTAMIIERGVRLSSSMTPMSLGIFREPIDGGYMSSDYGWRVVFGKTDFHYGLDYAKRNAKDVEVLAAADGEVVYSQWHNGGYGYRVEILHENGMITTYSHCESLAVEVGDIVKAGDVLGIMGTTGKSTGVHVHFEVIIDGVKVDPEIYVKES